MEDVEIRRVLKQYHHVAVVGLSPKEDRPSFEVAQFLQEHGYHIVPVHPQAEVILGEQVYARLEDIPFSIDIVDVFRRSEEFIGHVQFSPVNCSSHNGKSHILRKFHNGMTCNSLKNIIADIWSN